MLGVYSLLLVGGKGLLKFIELLQISAEGAYYGFEWDEMYNLLGLTLRFSSQISVEQARVTAWFFVLFVIGLLSYLWWHFPHSLSLIGISVVLATFVSPHLYLHSLGFLMLPLIAGMIILRQQGYEGLSILLPPIVSVLFILALLIVPDLSYFLGYVIMATLLVGLSILQHRASQA